MAVTRRTHRIVLPTGMAWDIGQWDARRANWIKEPDMLEVELNKRLTPGERIVGTHCEGGGCTWYIITEDYGLGPAKPRTR